MNSIAILILTNCIMPLFTFFVLKWILGEIFQIAIPMPPMSGYHGAGPGFHPGSRQRSGPGSHPEFQPESGPVPSSMEENKP
jgi:hypothetical protein